MPEPNLYMQLPHEGGVMSDNEKLIEEDAKANKNDLLDFLSKGEAWQAIRGMDAPGLATELDAAGFRRHVVLKPSADTTEHGDLIAWHVEQIESLRPFIRSGTHLKAAMMHAATLRALRAVRSVQTEPSEEQIDAMQEVLYDDNRDGDRDVIRRALRAASVVTEQGENSNV